MMTEMLQIDKKITNSLPLYEENYLRLQMLLSGWLENQTIVIKNSRNQTKINVHVIERFKYTTIIDIKFDADIYRDVVPGCVLKVGLYHDAGVAEVLAFQGKARLQPYYTYPNQNMYHRDEKRQVNAFLKDIVMFFNCYGTICEVLNHEQECG